MISYYDTMLKSFLPKLYLLTYGYSYKLKIVITNGIRLIVSRLNVGGYILLPLNYTKLN